jgi:hypothetical protein
MCPCVRKDGPREQPLCLLCLTYKRAVPVPLHVLMTITTSSYINFVLLSARVENIVACRPVAKQWICKQRPLLSNIFLTWANGLTGKRCFCAVRAYGWTCNNAYSNRGTVFSVQSVPICTEPISGVSSSLSLSLSLSLVQLSWVKRRELVSEWVS